MDGTFEMDVMDADSAMNADDYRRVFQEYPKERFQEERRLEGRGAQVVRLAGIPKSAAARRFAGVYVQESPNVYRQTLWTSWGPWKLVKCDGDVWRVGSLHEDGCEISVVSKAARPSEIKGEWR